jgi:hypothetical protein
MPRSRQQMIPHAWAALGWTLALLVGVQLMLGAFLHHVRPELRDPEYGSLLRSLGERLAEAPGRPLVLILGSSRTANVFRPSALPPAVGRRPVVFNFATLATGPVRQLQMLRRVLDRGVRPAWVVAEMWPPYLAQRRRFREEEYIPERDLQGPDWPLLGRYITEPWPAYQRLLEAQLAPVWHYRRPLLRHYAPYLVRPDGLRGPDWADPRLRAEGCGWLPAPVPRPDPELFRRAIELGQTDTRLSLADFAVSATAAAAVRELLQTCAGRGIRAALVLGPEHSTMRACFSPQVEATVATYLGGLSRELGVPVIDTRDWVPDDDFIDMTHALPRAASPYTERFGREVLWPLLAGRPLDGAIIYPHGTGPESSSGRLGASH